MATSNGDGEERKDPLELNETLTIETNDGSSLRNDTFFLFIVLKISDKYTHEQIIFILFVRNSYNEPIGFADFFLYFAKLVCRL